PIQEVRADALTPGDALIIPRPRTSDDGRQMPRWIAYWNRLEEAVSRARSTLPLSGNQSQALESLERMATVDFLFAPIKKLRLNMYTGPVYNIEVEEDHSYTANLFAVANCQNADISQRRKVEGIEVEPQDVVRMTLEQGCQGLAYTYNQPTIFIEFARDIGMMARKAGLF